MRVLTWNLFHGRSVPDAQHALRREFADAIAGWAWDVALLQEVPPWWPTDLARAAEAQQRTVLTSRNALLGARRAVADRRPGLIKANGGGANAILVRGRAIGEHREALLRRAPERRVGHAVHLPDDGIWVANLHAQNRPLRLAHRDIARAAAHVTAWADGGRAILGGDFNVSTPTASGFEHAGGAEIDHVLIRDLSAKTAIETLDAGPLSDHPPVVVDIPHGKT
jgi:endonuclease/exonuclease/phosphatase family metal-dependent hydrolase